MKTLQDLHDIIINTDTPLVVTIQSELYGSYNLELIVPINNGNGNVQMSHEVVNQMDKGSYSKQKIKEWSQEFIDLVKSPDNDIPSHLIESLPHEIQGFYIPTKRVNLDWYKENKDCNYLVQCPKVRTLPIITYTDKQLNKFIEKNSVQLEKLYNLI